MILERCTNLKLESRLIKTDFVVDISVIALGVQPGLVHLGNAYGYVSVLEAVFLVTGVVRVKIVLPTHYFINP
jgi:hypothetical protein